jgi:surfeit locus 1 family protein
MTSPGRRWLYATVIVIALAILFINLGFWQLRRHEERHLENDVFQSRFTAPPLTATELLIAVESDVGSLEYRRASLTGTYQPDYEVLVRSQVFDGVAGFHVVTPLLVEEDLAILVNRGWVPLEMDEPPVEAAPSLGVAEVAGTLHPSQTRAALGPRDQAGGHLRQVARVDISALEAQMPWPLLPVYLVVETGDQGLPLELAEPDFEDGGPHLAYAVQWFSFALIGVVGYLLLIRRIRGLRGREPADHLD